MLTTILAQVTVAVTGVSEPTGDLYVQLCRRPAFLAEACTHQAIRPAATTIDVTFDEVTPGLWAASVWHDVDGDGEMATRIFGIPAEPVAISNNPPARFGPPSFEDAAVEIGTAPVRIDLDLSRR